MLLGGVFAGSVRQELGVFEGDVEFVPQFQEGAPKINIDGLLTFFLKICMLK